jgi:penicillin V acylase-like amidase (Ntn superfamily)
MTLRRFQRAALASVLLAGSASVALACTRVLWNDNGMAVLTGRTMDWPTTTDPIMTILPRGLKHDGGMLDGHTVIAANPLRWTSKYGSLVTTVYGAGAADGINERGLAGHLLYFNAADYGKRDTAKPGLHAGLWLQYVLDTAGSVSEALAALEPIQLVMVESRGSKASVHVAIEDASGDSAIIEYIDGKMVAHHGRKFRVMTNDPAYDEQLTLLKAQDFSKPSSEMPLPGNVNPRDRFQRATYFSNLLPKPKTEPEAVASIFAIARNVSVPFGAPYKDFGIYTTEYRTVTDLTNKRYFFELTNSPNVVWVDLAKFNLHAGAPVMALNPANAGLNGDVTARFKKAAAPY